MGKLSGKMEKFIVRIENFDTCISEKQIRQKNYLGICNF